MGPHMVRRVKPWAKMRDEDGVEDVREGGGGACDECIPSCLGHATSASQGSPLEEDEEGEDNGTGHGICAVAGHAARCMPRQSPWHDVADDEVVDEPVEKDDENDSDEEDEIVDENGDGDAEGAHRVALIERVHMLSDSIDRARAQGRTSASETGGWMPKWIEGRNKALRELEACADQHVTLALRRQYRIKQSTYMIG